MVAWNCQETWFTEIFKQFWATVNAKWQLHGYEWGYVHEKWNSIAWTKIMHPGH